MIYFPKGVRSEYLIAAALALGSCAGPGLTDKQKDEVGDIAGDVAADVVGESDQFLALKSRVEEIEQKLNM